MPNTPKAEILACSFRAYPAWHVYRLGSSGLFRYFYGNSGEKGLRMKQNKILKLQNKLQF